MEKVLKYIQNDPKFTSFQTKQRVIPQQMCIYSELV